MRRMLDATGGIVRFFRELKGLSQRQLADAAKLHKDFISNLERCTPRYRNVTSDNLTAIAAALNIHPGILLDKSLRHFFRDTSIDGQVYIKMSQGQRIQALRKWRGLSPAVLAKKCDLSVNELKQQENSPRLSFVIRHRIAFALEVEPYWISLEGARLDPCIDSKSNKVAEDFSALFSQLSKSLQEIVLKSGIALMHALLSKQSLPENKDRKRKKK